MSGIQRVVAIAWAFVGAQALGAGPATRPYPMAPEAPLNAKLKLLKEEDGFTQHRIEFDGINKDRVPAFLYVPKDGKAKRPAVLCQYGSGGNKNTDYIVFLDREFVKRGFVVITIDIPFKGERKTPDGKPPVFGPRFPQTCGDYSRAVDYLASREDVDANRIGFVGISWGAITGVTYVAHDPRIKAMVSLVGGGNFIGWFPGQLSDETRKAAQMYDPVYHVGLIAPRPLLLINVTKDVLVPKFFGQALQDAAGPDAKKIWLETTHYFEGVDYPKLAKDVIDFVEAGMK